MSIWRLALGIALLALGLTYVLGRDKLQTRFEARSGDRPSLTHPMLLTIVGWTNLLAGVTLIVSAFV
jgi:uncharacterized membrane protein HdeD (DUF308 family)